jgi:gliding motility-associatede transport system auxiliary component
VESLTPNETQFSMANDKPTDSAPKVVTIHRLQIGTNVLVQIIATVLIFGMVNYLAFNHFKRWDVSRNQKYTLSDKTKLVVKGLKKPVKMIVFFTSGSDVLSDLENLLKEYQYAAGKQVEIENIDVFRNLTRAREVAAKYKLGGNENVLVVDYDGRSKVLNAIDMADYDTMAAEMFSERPRIKAFKGEQVITSALIELTEPTQNKAYVLEGHGEPELASDALGILKTYVERENIKLEKLNLLSEGKIHDDAKTLLLIGPKYDFTEREMKMLKDYWERKGRLLVALDPASPVPRLSAFLQELGITRNDDRLLMLVDLAPGLKGIVSDPTAAFLPGSPITGKLTDVATQFIGGTQSLVIDQKSAPARGLRLQKLVESAKGFWGETDYRNKDNVSFDPNKDHAGPLTIAVSVEKGAPADQRIKVDSSRMVVVGNSAFVTSDALREVGQNVDFAINALDWLLAREELIGIAPKEATTFSLNLTDRQLNNISLITCGGIPLLVAAIGFAVWWQRRR